MKFTKRAFSIKFNFQVQWLDSLCLKGVIPYETVKGGRVSIFIDDSVMSTLIEGEHFVVCPHCHKKMGCITKRHYVICPPQEESIYCALYLKGHKKTEEQKIAQSNKLKERFKTPEGEITRKQIGEASIAFNANPEVQKKRSAWQKVHQNEPEVKQATKERTTKMWADPEFREKRRIYVEKNIESLKRSALNARSHMKKHSELHSNYKKRMLEAGLENFITEYTFGYYSIDEADPVAKIAVEVDGCYWHGCSTCGFDGDSPIKATDSRKNSYLKNRGWLVLHIKEHEIKKDPFIGIEMIRTIQAKRREAHIQLIRESFLKGELKVKSMANKGLEPVWAPVSDIVRHHTPHKNMVQVSTIIGSVNVTEDHSLFSWNTKEAIIAKDLKEGDFIVGLPGKEFEPIKVLSIKILAPQEYTYDVSVPEHENAVLDSGLLVHNTYSISGVSLDIEKSSKYQSMQDSLTAEYDKLVEQNKMSIKIVKGLRQQKFGVGISSALGPMSRPGVQSRRNMISAGQGGGF
jgi:very-short-patch-repair endonuclease